MSKRIISAIIILLVIFAAFVSINNPYLNSIALYVIIPFAFCLSIVHYGSPLVDNKYMQWLCVLYCWIGLTYFGAYDQIVAQDQMKAILGVILLSSIISNMAKNPNIVLWLYLIYVCLFISAVNYAQTNILNVIGENERASDDVLNANLLAYYTFYVSCAIYVLGDCIKKTLLRKIMRYLFFSLIFISVWIALITASRQVLVVQVPLISILLIIRYGRDKRYNKLFYIVLIAVLFTLFFSNILENIFDGSLLQERYEVALEDDERVHVLREAIDVGNSHPLFGIGPGNFVLQSKHHVFSHCSYTELYANSGFPAVIIFVLMILYYISRQLKRYRTSKDTMYLFFMFVGIFFAIDNFFYVFYPSMWLMTFFILVASHSETYYRLQKNL